jgi:1-acyl-sn-glycerol-3-phosphate acyltransferase
VDPLYRVGRLIVAPFMRLTFTPRVEGLSNIPPTGGAILAGNHLSVADQLFLGSVVPRQVHFWAKEDYFHLPGVRGKAMKQMMHGLGTIPVHREGGRAALHALDAAVPVLQSGELVGIFPEGTRSLDGKLYRGRTGVARLAMEAGVPVIPVGFIGTEVAQPKGHTLPKVSARKHANVVLKFGKLMDFSKRSDDMSSMRAITDEIMVEIQKLTGQEYTGRYAKRPPAAPGSDGAADLKRPPAAPGSDNAADPKRPPAAPGSDNAAD